MSARFDRVTRRIEGVARRGVVVSVGGGGPIPGARVPSPEHPPPSLAAPAKVKVALCQLEVGADKAVNIAGARRAIYAAAADGRADRGLQSSTF